ncbi:hypothetical protein BD324DRAFT_614563 [Kockovaella imperatae]|uniref:Rad52/22 family double-strand break repair protein-domain-containing protein n=1 Tax=Kockovaella imperatae TaxID=4999 RepID=A0A1Y1URA6_9TREE|nr:hypothetical protein BD324DRAFT_614563 [Kockovaella imperatae]ORX39675.1 hypothetical protein BD324DRAFT_614563 [Kockovaella imperatae]
MSLSTHLIEAHEKKPYMAPPISPWPQSVYRAGHPPQPPQPFQTPVNTTMNDGDSSWMMGHGMSSQVSGMGGFTKWSEERVAALQVRLARKLGPEYVTQRPGPSGGPKLSYIEGWKVINLANEVFGFNGWSSTISSLTTDFIDVNKEGRASVNVTAIVRITLADGCWHEDVGCGQGENQRSKAAALDKAKKEAVTDATKRALKTFGNVLGLCLYDKSYTSEVVRMKVPQVKFNPRDLERRPEFVEPDAPGPSRPTAIPSHMPNVSRPPAPQQAHSVRELRPDTPQAPDTPLKEIQELGEDVFMDESFDAEFLDEQDELFYQDRLQANTRQNVAQGPQNPATSAPAYQHRHRPDLPPPNLAARGEFTRSVSDPAQKLENGRHLGPRDSGLGNRAAAVSERGGMEPKPMRMPMPRPQSNSSAGKSARALAISSALAAQGVRPPLPGPPRAESPRIPSGGVASLSARTTGQMTARAAALGLEGNEGIPTGDYQGFGSARGFKRTRSIEERP